MLYKVGLDPQGNLQWTLEVGTATNATMAGIDKRMGGGELWAQLAGLRDNDKRKEDTEKG